MSVYNPQKTVTPAEISCHGSAEVTIRFKAGAGLPCHPADIVCIMDRSCSMDNTQMCFAIQGVKGLIRMLSEASTGDGSGNLGSGSRMGLVSFASEATQDVPLTHLRAPIMTALANLTASGSTNHSAAFLAAEQMLGPKGQNRQIVILFTDGCTTAGGDASHITDRMKQAGIEIYCIGLLKSPEFMAEWVSSPVDQHLLTTTDQTQLGQLFRQVGTQILMPGVINGLIQETITSDFTITHIDSPSHGSVQQISDRKLLWTIPSAGTTLNPDTLSLKFTVAHVAATGGRKEVNESIQYQDQGCNTLHFPSPSIQVNCSCGPVYPEPCPVPHMVVAPNCQDMVSADLDETTLSSLGRIIQLNVTLKSICPGKRVGVSVILSEIGPEGQIIPRGVKHILVPAQQGERCRDVEIRCIQFSLPEALDASGHTETICNARRFQAQVLANYVDTDYVPCCHYL